MHLRSAVTYGFSRTLRATLVAVLTLCISGAAAGQAEAQVPGPSGQGDAPTANYAPGDAGEVLPESESGGADVSEPGSQGDEGSADEGSPGAGDADGSPSADGTREVERQVEAGAQMGPSLPFTGYAAVPVLTLGLLLLAAGVVLRRRVSRR